MRLYYVRHGDPIYNPDQLTPLGKLQAMAVAKRLARHKIDRIYSSTSNRAMETARPLCALLKQDMILQDWCNERYAFDALSVTDDKGVRRWGFADPATRSLFSSKEIIQMGPAWYEHPSFRDTSFKTGILRIKKETDTFLESFGYYRDEALLCYRTDRDWDGNIVLFAHGGVGAGIMSHILGIPYPQYELRFSMGTSTVTVIDFKERDGLVIPRVHTFANDSHIYQEGYPTEY